MAGKPGPVHDIVILNAAAGLVAEAKPDAERLTDQIAVQLVRAEEAIGSGAAKAKLEEWVSATRAFR